MSVPQLDSVQDLRVPKPSTITEVEPTVRRLMIFSDFDGTIFMQDTGHILFDAHGCGPAERERIDKAIGDGQYTFKEGSEMLWGSLHVKLDEALVTLKNGLTIDRDFVRFLRYTSKHKIPFSVISAGMKPLLEAALTEFLGPEKAATISIVSNDGVISEDGHWKVIWRHPDSPLGHDKALSIKELKEKNKIELSPSILRSRSNSRSSSHRASRSGSTVSLTQLTGLTNLTALTSSNLEKPPKAMAQNDDAAVSDEALEDEHFPGVFKGKDGKFYEYPLIVFIGDGVSDLAAASQADILFARKGYLLESFCIKHHIPYIPYDSFADIMVDLKALIRGNPHHDDGNYETIPPTPTALSPQNTNPLDDEEAFGQLGEVGKLNERPTYSRNYSVGEVPHV